ncbi:hypothetical protein RSOL_312230, partial [Rhizoctonia solani AG-3 Rhs1AP]
MPGRLDLDSSHFALDPSHPLRAILARHSSIRDLAVGCLMFPKGFSMDPDDLPRLLPSIKHPAFPSFMWESILKSDILALRPDSRIISDPAFLDDDGSNDPLDPIVNAMNEDTLPKLRKTQFGDTGLRADVLDAFVSAAKGLGELNFEIHVEGEFVSLMKGAENLCRIKWDCPAQPVDPGAMDVSYEISMKELAKVCPRLEEVVGYEGGIAWRVIRGDKTVICEK